MPKNRMIKLLEALPEPKPKLLPKQSMGKMQGKLNKQMPSLGQIAKTSNPDLKSFLKATIAKHNTPHYSGELTSQKRNEYVKAIMQIIGEVGQHMKQNEIDFTPEILSDMVISSIEEIVGKDNPEFSKLVAKDFLDKNQDKVSGKVKVGLKKYFDLAY